MEKEEENSGTSDSSIEKDVAFLNQLVQSLEKAGEKLEKFYRSNDPENLNKTKRFILEIQNKISKSLE